MNANNHKVFRARRVITPTGEVAASVVVRDGRIAAVEEYDAPPAGEIVDVPDDSVLLPGLVDSHVHVNEPGRTEWEGFDTATRAAAAGGVTTLIDMPLNSIPPTTDIAALAVKRAAAAGRCTWMSASGAAPSAATSATWPGCTRRGCSASRRSCCTRASTSSATSTTTSSRTRCAALADLDALLIVHAEDAPRSPPHRPPHGPRYADFLASRPAEAEHAAIADTDRAGRAASARGCTSCTCPARDALPLIARRASRRRRVTAETCPHYLTFAAEDIPDGATEFKCCPPIRELANRERLWAGLADGIIDSSSPTTRRARRS